MTFANAKAALLRISDCGQNQEVTNNIKIKQETLDPNDAIFYGENEENSNDEENIWFQNGNRPRRNPYNRNNSSNNKQQCYGCGESNHWLRDCPKNKRFQNSNRSDMNRQCYGCGDRTHWIKDCPFIKDLQSLIRSRNTFSQRGRNTYYTEDGGDQEAGQPETPIFFQSNVGNEMEEILLVGETVNKAVLDSGASKTVCGTEWFSCYVDSINEKSRKEIKEFPSESTFKFGVGRQKAIKMVHLPVVFCGQKIFLEVHVVETDIPLLLSLETMKKLAINVNFEKDQAIINGNSFDLEMTSTGHYTLPLI